MYNPKLTDVTAELQARPRAAPPAILHKAALVLVLLVALTTGLSVLISPAPYSVLIVLGTVVAIGFLVACVRNPLLALCAALILTLLPAGLLPEVVHSILNRTLTLVAAATWGFSAIRQRSRFIWPAAASFLLAFILWAGLTLSWAGNTEAGFVQIVTYALRLVLFLILLPNQIRTPRALDRLSKALAFAGCVLASTGIAQVLLMGYAPGTRFALSDVNENLMGVYLLVALPGVLWQVLKPAPTHRVIWLLAAGLYIGATIALIGISGSRGSAISLLVTLAGLWLWKPTRPWGNLGLGFIVLAAFLVPSMYTTTVERFAGASGETALGGREALWQEAWGIITEHPLIGVGVGNSGLEMRRELMIGRTRRDNIPIHNPVLVLWSETGMLGLALYLAVLISATLSFFRSWRIHRASGSTWLSAYFSVVASVQLGQLISWIKSGGAETTHTYFLMLALLVIPSYLAPEEQEGGGER